MPAFMTHARTLHSAGSKQVAVHCAQLFHPPNLVECFLPTPNGFCFAIVYHNAFAQASTFAGGANAGARFLLSHLSRANARFSPRHPQRKNQPGMGHGAQEHIG